MKPKPICRQRGITLLESLVAIVVVALGLLGILGVQLRTLTDTRTSVHRVQAMRLIEDLSERLRVQPNALGNLGRASSQNLYIFSWSQGASLTQPKLNCSTASCTAAELAEHDLYEWRIRVQDTLPGGDATTFLAKGDDPNNRRQIGVMVAWRENERVQAGASGASEYLDPIDNITAAGGASAASDVTCPTGKTCHLEYIPLGARCELRQSGEFACPDPKT